MSEAGPADLAGLLTQLNATSADRAGDPLPAPSPTEAMAMYFVASRLVELQLQLADRGECTDDELAVTRDVLTSTRRLLNDALVLAEASMPPVPARPTLSVVPDECSAPRVLHPHA